MARRRLFDARPQGGHRFTTQAALGKLVIHAEMEFGDVGETDAVFPQQGIILGREQPRRQAHLMQRAPEFVLAVGVIGFLQGRLRAGTGPAKDQPQTGLQPVGQNGHALGHQ